MSVELTSFDDDEDFTDEETDELLISGGTGRGEHRGTSRKRLVCILAVIAGVVFISISRLGGKIVKEGEMPASGGGSKGSINTIPPTQSPIASLTPSPTKATATTTTTPAPTNSPSTSTTSSPSSTEVPDSETSFPSYVTAIAPLSKYPSIPSLYNKIELARTTDFVVQIAVFGGSYTTGVGWDAESANKARYEDDSQCSLGGNCFSSSWPGRLQVNLDDTFGANVFRVVNLGQSGSCSGCMAGSFSSVVKRGGFPIIEDFDEGGGGGLGRIDLALIDFSVNDANTNRLTGGANEDPRRGNMAGLEQMVLRLFHCLPTQVPFPLRDSLPALIFLQDPPVSWTPSKVTGRPSSFPVYETIAENYDSIYLDLNSLNEPVIDGAHWPHPVSAVHKLQSNYVSKVIEYISVEGGGSGGRADPCALEPVTSVAERSVFTGCDALSTYFSGPEESSWMVVSKDIGWGVSHNDVPSRTDGSKTGMLYESDVEGADFARGNSKISFPIKLGSQRMMTVDYLRTYEHIGYARCFLEGYENESLHVLEGYWQSTVSLTSTSTMRFSDIITEAEAADRDFVLSCVAKAPTNYFVNTSPWHFKIMGIAAC